MGWVGIRGLYYRPSLASLLDIVVVGRRERSIAVVAEAVATMIAAANVMRENITDRNIPRVDVQVESHVFCTIITEKSKSFASGMRRKVLRGDSEPATMD
jgi:hypothetical protein